MAGTYYTRIFIVKEEVSRYSYSFINIHLAASGTVYLIYFQENLSAYSGAIELMYFSSISFKIDHFLSMGNLVHLTDTVGY